MTTLAIANQKGGVGKTTTVINLGAYLGSLGSRVLLVDCDPQANTTSGLGVHPAGGGLYDVLVDWDAVIDTITPTPTPGVDLLPSSPDLAGAEVELLDAERPDGLLAEALIPIADRYDTVLLDCPPSLGLLTLNALAAADAVLVPVQCEYLALEGLARLMSTLDRVKARSNPRLQVFGLVLTMYDGRTMLSQQVADEVRRVYPGLVFETIIPRSVRLGEAPSFGIPIAQYDPQSRGALAYHALAVEVVARLPQFHSL